MFQREWVKILEVIDSSIVLEVLPIAQEIEKENILLVIVYRMPDLLGFFIDDFILFINEMATQHRILIAVDFNLDQMLPKHVTEVDLVILNFNLSQRSLTVLKTHIHEKYWIWYLILQIPILLHLFRHPKAIILFSFF